MSTPTPSPNPTVSYANVTSKLSYPKKDQAIVIESIDGYMLRDYLIGLSTVCKSTSIRFISRIANSRICIYMDTKQSANDLVDIIKQVKVKDRLLDIRPLITRNKRIVLSNVCPVIPHEIIESKFADMNIKVMSPITFLKVGIPEPGFSHIMSFRRQLFIAPEDESKLPESMQISFEDTNYWIYITNDTLKCFACNGIGHLAINCPQNSQKQATVDESLNDVDPLTLVEFSKPIQTSVTRKENNEPKGTKRLRSPLTSTTCSIENQDTNLDFETIISETSDDTSSNFSLEEDLPKTKTIKKKKKTLNTLPEEEQWKIIEKDLDPHSLPISLDIFRNLLDTCRGKQSIKEIVNDHTTQLPKLIDMCVLLQPKLDKNMKNRCTRFCRKLQSLLEQSKGQVN